MRYRRTLLVVMAALVVGSSMPAYGQLEIGTWVRQVTPQTPQEMTLTIEACCGSGRRLTYHVRAGSTAMTMVVETRLDGADAPVLMNGAPSGETMAITRLDATHASAVLKMKGVAFGTSRGTLSADGKTLTVINEYTTTAGGNPVGKVTEVWMKK